MSIAQDRSINSTQDRIVEAAVQLFSRQGFNGSSTSEITRLAGGSEATVFRHFRRQKGPLGAAIGSRLRRLRISKDLLGRLAIDESPRTALPGIIALLVETVRHQPETIRLLYVCLFELDHGS